MVEFLKSIGFRRSLLDPCVHVKHAEDGAGLAVILIEVDDFLMAAKDEEIHASLQGALQKRFHFGKWEVKEADFIGRRIKQEREKIRMDQEKYILEKLEAISLSRSQRAEKEAPLEEEEFKQFRSMLYKVSWVAHQTRPEAAGTVSILSSRLHKANVEDIILLNKMVGYLRSSSSQGLRIRRFDPKEMTFIGVSDAGGVDGEFIGVLAWQRWIARRPSAGSMAGFDIESSSSPRPQGESQRAIMEELKAEEKSDEHDGRRNNVPVPMPRRVWLQIFYRDLVFNDVKTKDWRKSISPFLVHLPEECHLQRFFLLTGLSFTTGLPAVSSQPS